MRRYNKGMNINPLNEAILSSAEAIFRSGYRRVTDQGRGLTSSTFRLNVSDFCGLGGAFRGCVGGIR